jgi:ATPase family associated with various cellular activities (AAA)
MGCAPGFGTLMLLRSADPDEYTGLKTWVVDALQQRVEAAETGMPAPDNAIMLNRIAFLRANPVPDEKRLLQLAQQIGLQDAELLAIVLCLAADNDASVARLVARAQDPIGGSQPLIGLVATILEFLGATPIGLATGVAAQAGLLKVGDERAALPERSLSIPPYVAGAMLEAVLYPPEVQPIFVAPIPMIAQTVQDLHLGAMWLNQPGTPKPLVVRTASQSEANAAVWHLSQKCKMQPVNIDVQSISANAGWLIASGCVPVFQIQSSPGERTPLPNVYPYVGPIILIASPDACVQSPLEIHTVVLDVPNEAQRMTLWQEHGFDAKTAKRAAQSYRQGAGRIADLATHVRKNKREQDCPKAELAWTQLTHAVQASQTPLDGLARKICATINRKDLVLPSSALADLDRIVARIASRNSLGDGLGAALVARYNPGVRILFTGESGTGKTLAAHWLSGQVGLPIYRVDQAALSSKWIGETEKNLATILDAAQHADVILFFDEADALFGARTDVGGANDRHANAQTNYLLQRIEDYEGVVVLATNNRDRFDPAFVRRLDSILTFPMPDAGARHQLWRAHLGAGHSLNDAQIAAIGMAVDLAGGHIRNIVLGAAVRAKAKNKRINLDDIIAATAEEFAKLGRPAPVIFS